ncbi:MAG TPA: VWA domain-containing protein [Acidimicrobiales bacterium]|nr:VWA domain-containing protein [Acidimicrobiales bacterium]
MSAPSPETTLGDGLLSALAGFVGELRTAGVPVSTTELLDAVEAVRQLPITERATLKAGLAGCLVKNEGHWRTFEALFDLYFSIGIGMALASQEDLEGFPAHLDDSASSDQLSAAELSEMAYRALMEGNRELMAALAKAAVSRYAGMEPMRPVGASYYVFKTLRQLQADALLSQLLARAGEQPALQGLLDADLYRRRMEQLRRELEADVTRRLVAERGPMAVAKATRRALPEDMDFMHLGREELAALKRAVQPLARKLAVHLARKRRGHKDGRLDFRATMRRSLSSGGAPVDPRFKSPRRSKPELWVLADISGSVAAFARFTLQLVYALSSQFSRTRAWAFIDGIDEVTDLLKGAGDIASAVSSINTQADVIWAEGHSDYGHALADFANRWGAEVTSRTTVLVLGDARSNYHPAEPWALADISARARKLWWLNPEPSAYWDTGDSVLAQYGVHCTGVYECRNLRQLKTFIEQLD